ncbi:FAD-linked oxidase C-terminal domain-containing protein [Paenibacillus sp. KACC 21273]|uniref:FAD-binding oxidoreductase n=1 Tax=Paenibacillus sp. KACC 21273 TaxID=3025665 RepID=UPI002366A39B|nr:FAD-linked oxidase C-terminal domain-containing protein [Paenibacillus sp. KACC 21273]WDF52835.1 FAD-linked oxidase C-terminal domain-containing protein [Paenibacillus sp. KACC 21273]
MIDEIKNIIKEEKRVITDKNTLLKHSNDTTSYHFGVLPDVVVYPKNTNEISALLRYASKNKISITPFGHGTSTDGHVIPVQKGISLNMTLMKEIVSINSDNLTVTVEAGISRKVLNEELKRINLFFPVNPGMDATIGGMVSTNASGSNALLYGAMKHNVLGLTVVLPDGMIIKTGGLTKKSSSGYNLTSLFIGAEGTLGVVTEVILSVKNIIKNKLVAKLAFKDIDTACQTSVVIGQSISGVSKLELLDEQAMSIINYDKKTTYPVSPHLFIEVLSESKDVSFIKNQLIEILKEHKKIIEVSFEYDFKKIEELWKQRNELAFSVQSFFLDKKLMTTDVCVPISNLAIAIKHAREQMKKHDFQGVIVSHAGDGNFHVIFPVNIYDANDIKRAHTMSELITEYALSIGGTSSGEHGIGLGKKKHLQSEHGNSLILMNRIKETIDPNNIMNPQKII